MRPPVEQRDGVVELAVLDPGQADQHRRAAVGGLARERLAGGAAGLLERRLQHQVLGRIAGEEQFRRQHEVGAEAGAPRARAARSRSRLPAMSPTMEAICASAMTRRLAGADMSANVPDGRAGGNRLMARAGRPGADRSLRRGGVSPP